MQILNCVAVVNSSSQYMQNSIKYNEHCLHFFFFGHHYYLFYCIIISENNFAVWRRGVKSVLFWLHEGGLQEQLWKRPCSVWGGSSRILASYLQKEMGFIQVTP